jgi:hypothetical protein
MKVYTKDIKNSKLSPYTASHTGQLKRTDWGKEVEEKERRERKGG